MLSSKGISGLRRVKASSKFSYNCKVNTCRQSSPSTWARTFSRNSTSTSGGYTLAAGTTEMMESKPLLATKSTWADRVQNTNILGGKSTLAALYSAARDPSKLSDPLRIQLPPLPQRVKGYPTPLITESEIKDVLSPLCRSGWAVEFRLPAESEADRTAAIDCGCGPDESSDQNERPFLRKAYQFASIQATDDFLADTKLLSDIGEFHHYDSYSLSPSNADGSSQMSSPASLTIFVQTHSAINLSGETIAGITMRDVRYAILLDHLYHSTHDSGTEPFLQEDRLIT